MTENLKDKPTGSTGVAQSDMLAREVQVAENIGSLRVDKSLGFQRMPEGYALMLNGDKTHYFWLCYDGTESLIDWNKWRVRKGAFLHSANNECRQAEPTTYE